MRYEERRNWELYWLVDPLDGTVEFIKGNNEFTVNIALMENNVCMGAVIYVPYFEKMYVAGRGGVKGKTDCYTMRRSAAQRVSSVRFDSCSLRSTELTCVSTVLMEINSSAATSLYV